MAVSSPDSNSSAPLLFGGYDCNFVEPPPESLLCPVCLLPFRDPTIPSCCGYKGCASCLGRIKADGKPCPVCKQPFTVFLDKYFQRKVLDLHVFCSKKEEGCPWEGELRDLDNHSRKDCNHFEQECRYKCGARHLRRFLHDHEMDDCPQRPPEIITQSLLRKMVEASPQRPLEVITHSLIRNMAERIDRLEKENASLRDEKEKLAMKMAEFGPVWLMDTRGTLSSPYPPCDIVMPYFSQKRRENYQWYSRPFYSAPGGYKLRLSVFANGYGNGKGTHVSLGIFLMKGENDDHLEWPFKHDVMYRILNWKRDEKHVVSKIAFKNAVRGENARVTTAITTANGGGQPKVLSHALLYDSKDEHVQYLNEDCLCVEVLAVEPPK